MTNFDLLSQLDAYYQKSKGPQKKQLDEKSIYRIYEDICKIYPAADSNDRIEIQIFFAGKNELLELLATRLSNVATKALQAAVRSKQNLAIPLIEQGLVIDAILDGRIHSPKLDDAHSKLLKTAETVGFGLRTYAKALEIPVTEYLRRAQEFYQTYDRASAVRTLSHVLQQNPSLANNPKIAPLAASITGQPAERATKTLSSVIASEQYVNTIEAGTKLRTKSSNFDSEILAGKTYIQPRKAKNTLSKSQARLVNVGLALMGMALMIGATIGLTLLIYEVIPSEKVSLSDVNKGSGRTILLMPTMGILMVLTGLVATVRREIKMGQFLNVKNPDEYEFSGPAAFVMGLSWMATGVLLIYSGLAFLQVVNSFGFLSDFLINPFRGVIQVMGMVLAMLLVGAIIRKMTPNAN
jgi:hypothetical protein